MHPNGDGKVRIKEIIDDFQMGPLCLFDVAGKLTAGLNAFVKVGVDVPFVGFVGWKKTFNIANATLLDFNYSCSMMPQPDPILATNIGSGVLRLNMGPFAAQRLHVNTTDGDETFVVTPGDSAGKVVVQAFGYTQTFSGVSKIYAEGMQLATQIERQVETSLTGLEALLRPERGDRYWGEGGARCLTDHRQVFVE